MIKLADLIFACFYLFLIVCYLIIIWRKELTYPFGFLLRKLGFNPICKTTPEFNEQKNYDYQNDNEYTKKYCISPRMLIKPILNDSPNYGDSYQAHNYCNSGIRLFFAHIVIYPSKLCIRVYRFFRRSQPKGNDTIYRTAIWQLFAMERQN